MYMYTEAIANVHADRLLIYTGVSDMQALFRLGMKGFARHIAVSNE